MRRSSNGRVSTTAFHYSELRLLDDCPLWWWKVHVEGERDANKPMARGTAVHQGIAARLAGLKGENHIRQEALHGLAAWEFTDKEMGSILDLVHSSLVDELLDTPGWIERFWRVEDFQGTADFVSLERDTIFVVDWKTGSSKWARMKQLRFYAGAFMQMSGIDRAVLSLRFLDDGEEVQEEIDRRRAEQTWEWARDLVEQMPAAKPNPIIGDHCRLCRRGC